MRKRLWGWVAAISLKMESVFSLTMNAGSNHPKNSFTKFVKYEATWTLPIWKLKGYFQDQDQAPKLHVPLSFSSSLCQFYFHLVLGLIQGLSLTWLFVMGLPAPSFFFWDWSHWKWLHIYIYMYLYMCVYIYIFFSFPSFPFISRKNLYAPQQSPVWSVR